MIRTLFLLLLITGLNLPFNLPGQEVVKYKAEVTRILFILDGSGSMVEKWGAETKFEAARRLLFQLADSVERHNPNVEFAVRVFGHQSERNLKDCKDSRLEVPFAKGNAGKILKALSSITPKGYTPIAYSIEQSAADFPRDDKAINAIILITDGLENCEGDPCKVAKALIDKRISLKPFIIGLGDDYNLKAKLNCAGTYFAANDQKSFSNTVGVIIRQTLNTTTAQVNLLDQKGIPSITNLPFTLYDHHSGKLLYNFIHALNAKGYPDTLYLDPVGHYDLQVHTIPPVYRYDIELVTGIHNIIAVDVPCGEMKVNLQPQLKPAQGVQVIPYLNGLPGKAIHVQGTTNTCTYLRGSYPTIISTRPPVFLQSYVIAADRMNIENLPYPGQVVFNLKSAMEITLLQEKQGAYSSIWRGRLEAGISAPISLQPGKYQAVYRPKGSVSTMETGLKTFEIVSVKELIVTAP